MEMYAAESWKQRNDREMILGKSKMTTGWLGAHATSMKAFGNLGILLLGCFNFNECKSKYSPVNYAY